MSKVYDYYFKGRSVEDGKSKMMTDIESHTLAGEDLQELIGELERQGILREKPFKKRAKEQWDQEYLNSLSFGFISDYFSRAYLEHMGEVSDHVYRRKKSKQTMVTAAVIVVVLAIGAFIISRLLHK